MLCQKLGDATKRLWPWLRKKAESLQLLDVIHSMLKTAALIKRQEAKVQSLKYLYSQIWNTVELTQSTLSAGRLREMIIIAIMKIMIIIIFSKLPFVKLPPQQQAAADPLIGYFKHFYGKLGLMSTRFSLPVRYHIWLLQKYIRDMPGERRILSRSELNAKARGTQGVSGCCSSLLVLAQCGLKDPDPCAHCAIALFSVCANLSHQVRPLRQERLRLTNYSSFHSFRVLGLNVG